MEKDEIFSQKIAKFRQMVEGVAEASRSQRSIQVPSLHGSCQTAFATHENSSISRACES